MPKHRISVTPSTLQFSIKPGDVCSATVQVNNLDTSGPISCRVKPPTTRWFKIRGIDHTYRIAPGISVTFEVVFDGKQLDSIDREFHDSIKITSETEDVELWVHACGPRPQLQLQGDLQYGMVGIDSKPSKQLRLVNKGALPAEYKIEWDKSLPLAIEPCTGVLNPGGSSNISARLFPVEVGAVVGEVVIAVAGRPDPYHTCVNATVVQQSYELLDVSNSAAITEMNFGSMFFGEACSRQVAIFNNGPAEVRFDLSYGSAADMKAIAAPDSEACGDGDQHVAFLQMARIRAKAREEKESVLKVSPITGVIAPYSTTKLQVTFKPLAAASSKGFTAQPLTPQQQAQLFDCLLQVSLAGGSKHLRLPIKGCGLAPHLTASPQVLHFGIVPAYEWADQLLQLSNDCSELPMHVAVGRSGPYFSAEPSELELPPGASCSVLLRYLPKALGRHQASLSFQVVSNKAAGRVLSEAVVQVHGSSLSLGNKQPLPGGITATPDTFKKPRAYVDESDAAVAELTAKKTFSRPRVWETADNAYSLEGIGPMDRFGVTTDVQMARATHAEQYTTFIRAGRTAAARKYLTKEEGDESDPNLGMQPYRGLSPGRLCQLPKQVDPLWTVKHHSIPGPAVQRPPSAAVLAGIPTFKEWPETVQERTECSAELTPAQLCKVIVGRQLDFGKVSPALPASQHFVVTNPLNTSIHVVLDLHGLEELGCAGPASQVIPAGSTAKFQLVLRCHDVQLLKEQIQYCINGCHMQSLDVVAEVVAVTLELSCEELMFSFSLDNWEDYVEQSLIMENPHNFPVDYEWALSSQSSVFAVSPASGTVKPKTSCHVAVRWTPGAAAAAPKSKPQAAAGSLSGGSTARAADADKRPGSQTGGKGKPAGSTVASSDGRKAPAASNSAITVRLPAEPADAAAVADAAALGCQHIGFMTLKLKGGADAAPKKVMLHGELPAGLLKFKEKEVNLGPVPVNHQQTVVVQLKNSGNAEASYRVSSNSLLSVSPGRGHVAAESVTELEVSLLPQPGLFSTVLEVEVRGGKPLKLPIRAKGVLPCVHVAEGAAKFAGTFIGASSQLPLTLVNTTPVPATLLCDLTQQPEFDIHVSREAWAAAGYAACPVQKIGANGEMSTVGSKRASRRMTSQGTRVGARDDGGYRFLIQLKPSSTLPLILAYRPNRAQAVSFPLPLVLHSSGSFAATAAAPGTAPVASAANHAPGNSKPGSKPGSAGSTSKAAAAAAPAAVALLAVPVSAVGVVPKLIISKDTVSFGSQVVRHSQQAGKSPYMHDVYMRNNTEGAIQVAVGAPSTNKEPACLGVYALEGLDITSVSAAFVSLGPEEGLGFTVRFSPTDARSYEAVVPIFIDGDRSAPYLQLGLSGVGTLPQLTFNVAECVLPPVPLNVTSRARFYVINGGYDNLELSVRLPPDNARLPLSLSFPEGNLIGLAKDRLPVDVAFSSSRSLSFTAIIDFLDESGRAFSVAVTGAADNCSLTHQPFMQLNADQLQLAAGAEGSGFLQLEDSADYDMPLDEVVGPMYLTPGVCKYLAAVMPRNWGSSSASSRASSSNGRSDEDSSGWSGAAEALRQALKSSRGKQLLELVELLGGKPVSLKGAGSKKPSGNKTEAAQQVLAMYEAILSHLRAHGGLLNSVKAEYLLDQADFERIMAARTAAAAGNPEQEQALELWAPVEAGFGSYSTQAWNCVLLQIIKMFVLARVTPAALRQLLGSTHTAAGVSNSSAAASDSKAGAGATQHAAVPGVNVGKGPVGAAALASTAVAAGQTASSIAASSSSAANAAAADSQGGYEVPSDEVLSSSNIYSTAEACLLAWMSAHMAKAFPQLASQVTNFSDDMRNGLVLGALLAAHWPGGNAGSLLSKLHRSAHDARHIRENQEMVVKALQELCLPYGLVPAELEEAEPANLLLLVSYLFTALPQLLPRATLDFNCKLGEQQVRDIQLANPTRRPLSYSARLEGHADFSLEASVVKIDPGHSTQVPIRFSPSTSLPKSCRLVLMSRRDGSSASAATLVFLLRGQVDSRAPLRQVAVQAPLYQLGATEFSITNPFPADCEFSISIVQIPPAASSSGSADKKGKGGKGAGSSASNGSGGGRLTGPAAAAAAAKKKSEQLQQQQLAVASQFPDPFGLDRHRLRLRAGASEKLKLSFLPFQMPQAQQQPEPAAAPGQPAAAPKAVTRSLLVLSDSDCGEFAYELCGEVLAPGPFLEHKATVGLEGQQTVELQLPFTNHLLEAARRIYAEKHPLAKDKEQAAKLRSDIGRSSDKGERLLEYTVSCSNSLISCPDSLVLKAGMPAPGGGAAAGAASRAVSANSISGAAAGAGSSSSGVTGHPQAQQQLQQLDGSKENVLKLGLKPVGCGVYPARVTLTSAYDVRVVDVEVTAQSMGQTCVLELECPARQQVLQEVPLVNSSDAALTATATLSGKGYSGPRDLTVPGKTSGSYPLTFCPPGSGTYTGTLELFIAATGEKNVYSLIGKGGEALAEGHIVVECQARSLTTRRLQVPNITGTLPLQYSVYADLECLSGPATHTCSSTNRGDTYKLGVMPLRSGSSWGSISFVTEDGQYCWYSIEVRASEPPDMGTISVTCAVRQAVALQVSLTNPADRPLNLRAHYSCPSLVGPGSFVAPPQQPCVFECYYAPLLVGKEEGVLRLVSDEAGEFWWRISMEAVPAGPEQLPLLTAPLGSSARHTLTISNPTPSEARFSCSSSDAARFCVNPSSLTVPGQGTAEVQLEYRPGSLGVEETGSVKVTSETAGSVEYICRGQGEMPSSTESATINSALGTSSSSSKLSWNNPFSSPATVTVQLSSSEPPSTFSLLLSGAEAVQQAAVPEELQRSAGFKHQQSGGSRARGSLEAADSGEDGAADCAAADAGGGDADDDDSDHLERAEPDDAETGAIAGLLAAAMGGGQGQTSRARGRCQQQQQQRLPVLQQVAQVTVDPHGTLQLPVSFAPQVLREAAAQLSVALVSPTVESPAPLVWHYQVQGLAHTDARGVKFGVKCKAKQSVDEVIAVPLPGLDPGVTAAIAAAGSSSAAAAGAAGTAAGAGAAAAGVKFTHELLLPEEHKAALAGALRIEQVDQLPVNGTAAAGAAAGADVPPVLRFKLSFAPQKAMAAQAQLAVNCSGARWVYDVSLMASAPEVEGVLVLEAHMGCTAELPLLLYSSGPQAQPFTADFTPDTPLNFDVLPAKGMLPPAAEAGSADGAAAAAAAPMKITFLCKEMGKVMSGRLVVVTPDRQYTYIVKGRQPAYVPPSRAALPSGTYLKAGTASSVARVTSAASPGSGSRSSSPALRMATAGSSAGADTGLNMSMVSLSLAGQGGSGGGGAGQQASGGVRSGTASKNYLQQNIKAAKVGSALGGAGKSSSSSSDGSGSKSSKEAARPWA